MRHRRLASVVSLLAVLGAGSVVAGCGGAEDPSGTVTQDITIGTGTQGTNPGGGKAGGDSSGAGQGNTGTGGSAEGGQGNTGEDTGSPSGSEGVASGASVPQTVSGQADSSAEDSGGGDDNGGGGKGDATAGKQVFLNTAGCGNCHTLGDAGTNGAVGPNLDEAKPDYDLVVDRVTNGQGAMPSFKGQLSDTDIQNVAAYVSSVAGK